MFRITSRIAFRSAAIAGIASALLLALVSTGVHAKGPPPNPFPVNCKFEGTFIAPAPDVLSTALGECKGLGQVNLTGILGFTGPAGPGCLTFESIGQDMIVFNKKGDSLNYALAGTQCLKTATGEVPTTPGFCLLATDTAYSLVTAFFEVLDGTGLLAGYAGGPGTLTGTVDHCAATFPFGNSFKGTMSGFAIHP